jgi:uncharacterized protein
MPIPKPDKDESQDDFIGRCMGDDVMNKEYPDQKQRLAICFSQWEKEKKSTDIDIVEVVCSKCGGDRFEPENNRLKCISCGTLRDKKETNMDKIEFRASPLESLELRAEDGKPTVMAGYAALFDKLSDPIMGSFREKIDSHAFDNTLDGDIRCLSNHDISQILGRTTATPPTLKVWVDEHGLRFEDILPDTQCARDLQISIKRGDIRQMSFAFECHKDEWDKSGSIPIRTLKDVTLFDVSPTASAAYPQTKVGVRGFTEDELVNVLDRYFAPKTEEVSRTPQELTEGYMEILSRKQAFLKLIK